MFRHAMIAVEVPVMLSVVTFANCTKGWVSSTAGAS
jgi:hypothetical protein